MHLFTSHAFLSMHTVYLISSLLSPLTAPLELPTKSRSFSLTSHQLRALTQLACTLLGFESDVKELVTNTIFIDCTGDTPTIKGNQLLQNAHMYLSINERQKLKKIK